MAIIVAIFLFFIFSSKKTKVVLQLEENAKPNPTQEIEFKEETDLTENISTENQKSQTADLQESEKNNLTLPKTTVQSSEDATSDFKIIKNLVSWGFESSSGRKIDTIIIHSSYNALGGDEYDFKKLLSEYKEYGVSPHYVIDRKGNVYRLVTEKNIAYHAGESKTPDGRTGVNNFSIGIEIMNTKSDKPTNVQYAALKNLIADIKKRYKIKYVLGHNQIAPGRKDDPWNFDWKKI